MVVLITSNFSICPNKSIHYLTIYAKKLLLSRRNWRDYWMSFPADPGAGSSGPEGWQRIIACARAGAESSDVGYFTSKRQEGAGPRTQHSFTRAPMTLVSSDSASKHASGRFAVAAAIG